MPNLHADRCCARTDPVVFYCDLDGLDPDRRLGIIVVHDSRTSVVTASNLCLGVLLPRILPSIVGFGTCLHVAASPYLVQVHILSREAGRLRVGA